MKGGAEQVFMLLTLQGIKIYQTIKKHASLIELACQDQRAGWPCLSACGFFFNVNERINPISAKTAATIKAEFMP